MLNSAGFALLYSVDDVAEDGEEEEEEDRLFHNTKYAPKKCVAGKGIFCQKHSVIHNDIILILANQSTQVKLIYNV